MRRHARYLSLFALPILAAAHVQADDSDDDDDDDDRGRHPPAVRYSVTLHNLTQGQPLSPPAAATHRRGIRMFKVGRQASPELIAIAEDGEQVPMVELFRSSRRTTEVVDVARPLTPNGVTVGNFTDAATFSILGRTSDRLSVATMLICTNDGFTGLNSASLPTLGSIVYLTAGYDAGSENNTEKSLDIVDPCSALGPMPLAGDPNGNADATVNTIPAQAIAHHPNVAGTGDLTQAKHRWRDPVLKVTVTVVDEDARHFAAPLTGAGENPPVSTQGHGWALLSVNHEETALRFLLVAIELKGVTQAHIHMGSPNENGPVVAFLVHPDAAGRNGILIARGVLSAADVVGPLEGDFAVLVARLRAARLYVNVHTAAHPTGEIRGHLGALRRKPSRLDDLFEGETD